MFSHILVLAFISRTIRPIFDTFSDLFVIFPLTFIPASIAGMYINAIAMCPIIKPFSFIIVTIGMYKLSLLISTVVNPITFINASIYPDLNTPAVSLVCRLFSIVLSFIFIFDCWLYFDYYSVL
jgi:hypothetical protein